VHPDCSIIVVVLDKLTCAFALIAGCVLYEAMCMIAASLYERCDYDSEMNQHTCLLVAELHH